MALKKEIEFENGLILNYHRIVSLNKITNQSNIIEIASYANERKREEEKVYYENNDRTQPMNIYIETTYINKDYDENENIEDAYSYLKTLEQYKNAENI